MRYTERNDEKKKRRKAAAAESVRREGASAGEKTALLNCVYNATRCQDALLDVNASCGRMNHISSNPELS